MPISQELDPSKSQQSRVQDIKRSARQRKILAEHEGNHRIGKNIYYLHFKQRDIIQNCKRTAKLKYKIGPREMAQQIAVHAVLLEDQISVPKPMLSSSQLPIIHLQEGLAPFTFTGTRP